MTDLKIIKQIEKTLKIKLPKHDNIKFAKGYTINQNGQVLGLGLFNTKTATLNPLFPF